MITKTPGTAWKRLAMATALATGVVLAGVWATPTTVLAQSQGSPQSHESLSDDWTHHHLVYSGARTAVQAEAMRSDARYRLQWMQRNRGKRRFDEAGAQESTRQVQPLASAGITEARSLLQVVKDAAAAARSKPSSQAQRDWSTGLPAGAATAAGVFPAKYTFDINAAPSCSDDFVAFTTSLPAAGGGHATATGTFTASSLSGTVLIDSTTLVASPGAAAWMNTTVDTNGVAAGNTITVTNGGSSQVYTASAPTSETGTITIGSTIPANNATATIGTVVYTFANTASLSAPASGCLVRAQSGTDNATQVATNLNNAIANSGTSTTTWRCAAGAAPNSLATSTRSTATLTVTASIPGATGFNWTRTTSPNTNFSTYNNTAGTDGNNTGANFRFWSGNAAAPAATLAANITTAMTNAPVSGVTASNSGADVLLTASVTGLIGNSITVATTIPSGLIDGAFNGNLSGGASGFTSTLTFSTSTDSATTSVNLAAAATALATAINSNSFLASTVTATANNGVVTVTAVAEGSAGNSIQLFESFAAGFAWSGSFLSGGAGGSSPASIVGFNNLYTSPIVGGAQATGAVVVNNSTPANGAIVIGNIQYSVESDGNVSTPSSAGQCTVTYPTTGLSSTRRNTFRTNLAAAVNSPTGGGSSSYRCNNATNTFATAANDGSNQVTLTAITAGTAGNSITLTTASANTSVTAFSGGTNPTGGGYCNASGPSAKFSYKTSTAGGSTETSPILSLDGSVILFVESRSAANGGAILRILRWADGEGGTANAPVAPAAIAPSLSACPELGSCLVSVNFANGQASTMSAPFYDYGSDILYVGDDVGALHKMTDVLNGTPVDTASGGWPFDVNGGSNNALAGPVFDLTSAVYVGDLGGTFYKVNTVTPNVANSVALGGRIVEAPLVDLSAERITVFGNGTPGASRYGRVDQFTTSLVSQATVNIGGTTNGGRDIRAGFFDDTYLTSAQGTGHLYVCGKVSNQGDRPALYRIGYTNGVMSTASDGTALALNTTTNGSECSPVTQVANPNAGKEWIFFSVGDIGTTRPTGIPNITGGCSTTSTARGCVMSMDITPVRTTLRAAVDNSVTAIPVTSTTGLVTGDRILIDSEVMTITDVVAGPTVNVTRGTTINASGSTTPAAHSNGATVTDVTGVNGPGTAVSASYPVPTNSSGAGTSGIVIDNVSTLSQASSLYFTFINNSATGAQCNGTSGVGCAVKLTQAGLQ